MKSIIIVLSTIFAMTAFSQEFEFDYHRDFNKILEQTKDSSSSLYYAKLLSRFKKNDMTMTNFDVLALLIGFTANDFYSPYNFDAQKAIKLNFDNKFTEALELCNSILALNPFNLDAIYAKSISFYELNIKDSSFYYIIKFKRIMRAMEVSGDGLSPETAIFALGALDGQIYIRVFLFNKIGIMGSGMDKYGNFVDILEMIIEDKETGESTSKKLYFNIQHATKKAFGKRKNE